MDLSRREGLLAGIGRVLRTIRDDGDDEALTEAVMHLGQSRRMFAPLLLAVGALAMLFEGLRVLLTNWRLMLIQIPPALWIWVSMLDLKLHVLHGRSLNGVRGPVLIPVGLAIVAVTVLGFFLDAVFAYAIVGTRPPDIGAAYVKAREHLTPVLVSGVMVGAALALAMTIAPRWAAPWFTLTLGVVVGAMMICFVAVPSRLIGVKRTVSRRDKITASMLSGAVGATVSAPPYVLGRIGLLMLGSRILLVPGLFVVALGLTLQVGATASVRAIKLGAVLASSRAIGEHSDVPSGPRVSGGRL